MADDLDYKDISNLEEGLEADQEEGMVEEGADKSTRGQDV